MPGESSDFPNGAEGRGQHDDQRHREHPYGAAATIAGRPNHGDSPAGSRSATAPACTVNAGNSPPIGATVARTVVSTRSPVVVVASAAPRGPAALASDRAALIESPRASARAASRAASSHRICAAMTEVTVKPMASRTIRTGIATAISAVTIPASRARLIVMSQMHRQRVSNYFADRAHHRGAGDHLIEDNRECDRGNRAD